MPSPEISNGVQKGVIDSSGVKLLPIPVTSRVQLTATLKSAAAGRKIELSADDGDEFFPTRYNVTTPSMLVLAINTPISHILFTGTPGDKWSLR